ncbi:unnamed protein product [Fraxinus pennsylvanica]|uniref:Choline transporter-like protein n=1 Tax=Fraxinus pennsylvanica TaxID=56036 RepID=A0AAD2DVH5_9LAMI|nr:unnamed protein product [Fraxinus pennsylvanica]
MGAAEPVVHIENEEESVREEEMEEKGQKEDELKDLEKGEMNIQKPEVQNQAPEEVHMSRMRRLSNTNPLRLVMNNATRFASPSHQPPRPSQPPQPPPPPPPPPPPLQQPRSTPTPQQSVVTLNSRSYTNRISLFLFLVHMVLAFGLVCFMIFKGVQGLIEEAGILLICFQRPETDGVGALFIVFAIGNGLYACWVSHKTGFCSKIFIKALEPVSKFPDLNRPTYWMVGAGFCWMSFWILAVIGSLNFYAPPLIIIALVLSLAWTAEVMRNVANLTVSRVISLYYLRGMQSSTQFCFQRALSNNLGSACLGSLFVPAIEALRILARGLNLLEGEDEFMFSCAHCCLRVMESIFRRGNGWAYVQIAAYGKDFVKASQDTWELFEKREMAPIVDSDITSAICFLTGVCSGSICVIVVAAWTATVHRGYTATLSVLAAFIGYLMTRIAMALPQACVSCYYVCYAENPENRLFDKTIPDRINLIKSGRDVVLPTPRIPRRFTR